MTFKHRLFALASVGILFPYPVIAAEGLFIQQERGSETITLATGSVSPNKVFILENPARLVVDVPTFPSNNLSLPDHYKNGLISKLRTGHFNATTTRLVFDLNQKISVKDKQEKNGKLMIAIASGAEKDNESDNSVPSLSALFSHLEKPKTEPAKAGKDRIEPAETEEEKPPEEKREIPFRKASDKNRKTKTPESKVERKTDSKEKALPQDNQKPEKKKIDKKSTLSTKNKFPVVVIDPGHGGIDPGTSGGSGAIEKMIVLDYAQALKSKIQKLGPYQVVLTRDHDEFIMLRKRVEIARKAKGDIFISLHADSAPGAAHGLSIYTVSEKASDEEAESLASRENKADVLAGINLEGEREDVAGILISLAERDTKNRSATLADILVTSLDDKVHLLPDSHRFAGFAVLKAPDIPSVLIEIGFLSSPSEEKLIKSKAYRDKVISGIASGVDSYFKKERQAQE